MNCIKKTFPQAMYARDLKNLFVTILIYAGINLLCGLLLGFLDDIPLIGLIFGLIDRLLDIYCAIGVLISLLVFLRIVR